MDIDWEEIEKLMEGMTEFRNRHSAWKISNFEVLIIIQNQERNRILKSLENYVWPRGDMGPR